MTGRCGDEKEDSVMDHQWRLSAFACFDEETAIRYSPCGGGDVELLIGGEDGFNLLATDAGLARLADVIEAARSDERRLRQLRDPYYED